MFTFTRSTILVATLVLAILQAQAQNPFPIAAPQSKNAASLGKKFLLAAPAGQDSGQMTTPPPGAVNQGPLDPPIGSTVTLSTLPTPRSGTLSCLK